MGKQLILDIHKKLIVDLFAGGGGMSVAVEIAFGRSPDIAINHNEKALSMHRANHPLTRHFIADIFEVCPHAASMGRPVGWLHASPDCTDHSQAGGGQPRRKKIRGLAWVVKRWGGQVLPDVLSLENVKQIRNWGPLIAKRCKKTGRVVTLDIIKCPKTGKKKHRVAEPGEHVPVKNQYLIPDPKKKGQIWRKFVADLEALGYEVEHKTIVAADQGGHTTRERLWMIARRDGLPIQWPQPTHFKKPKPGQKKWKPAADCIDFSDLGQSIFDRPKDLADATMLRIAKGIKRYVLDNPTPYIVNTAPHLVSHNARAARPNGIHAAPVLVGAGGPEYAGKPVSVTEPLGTAMTENHRCIATAYMMQANDGFNTNPGRELVDPMSTITNTGSQQQLVTAFLSRQFGKSIGHGADEPHGTITAGGGGKSALVECVLSQEQEVGALRVAAFLMEYYSTGGQWCDLNGPMNTVTTKDRLALVTVFIQGEPYVIVDIRLRMLKPRELFLGQDFPKDYIIDRGHDGRKFTNAAQVHMCGNSVDPVMATAFLQANAPWLSVKEAA